MENKKGFNKIKLYLIGGGVFVFLIFLIVIIAVVGNKTPKPVDKEEDINSLEVYKSAYGYCFDKNDSCKTLAFKIEVKNKDALIKAIEKEYILIDDNGLFLYDVKAKEKKNVNINNNYDYYQIFVNDDKAIGISYGKDKIDNDYYKEFYYYNLKDDSVFEGDYNRIVALNNDYLEGKNYANKVTSLIKRESKEEVLKVGNLCSTYSIESNYYVLKNSCSNDLYSIYTKDGKELALNLGENKWSIDLYGYFYMNKDNVIYKYNTAGEYVMNSKIINGFRGLILNYVVLINEGKLQLYDVTSSKYINIADLSNDYVYNSKSGYYKANVLSLAYEKKEGIYILLSENGKIKGKLYYYSIDTGQVKEYDTIDVRENLKSM